MPESIASAGAAADVDAEVLGATWGLRACRVPQSSPSGSGKAAYTAAGQAALNRGCLIVAAAGNDSGLTGAPANSPTIFAGASLDATLKPSSLCSKGKIEIAAPGRDVFSAVQRGWSTWHRPTGCPRRRRWAIAGSG